MCVRIVAKDFLEAHLQLTHVRHVPQATQHPVPSQTLQLIVMLVSRSAAAHYSCLSLSVTVSLSVYRLSTKVSLSMFCLLLYVWVSMFSIYCESERLYVVYYSKCDCLCLSVTINVSVYMLSIIVSLSVYVLSTI